MLSRLLALAVLLAVALVGSEAKAERRVALVIGNAQYAHAPPLRNTQNDANDMAEALKKLGFEVLLGLDLDQRGLAQSVERFARMLDGADVAMFYYAGHAIQINDRNFLVSVGAQLTSEFLVPSETIELDAIVRLMESKSRVNLVFLDACRNNPLADDLRRNLAALKRSVSLGRGLARIEPTSRDTLVAFAAAPGQEASDGQERNSPFTRAVLRHIATPGQEVSVMLKQVSADVRRETRDAQRPQQVSDMSRTFYFAKADQVAAGDTAQPEPPRGAQSAPPPVPTTPAPARAPNADRELDVAFWNAAQAANECEAVRAYLTRFPRGIFIELAKLSERRLCKPAQVAAAEPPPAAPQPPPASSAAPQQSAPASPSPPPAAAPAVTSPAPAPREPRTASAPPSSPPPGPSPPIAAPASPPPPAPRERQTAAPAQPPATPPAPPSRSGPERELVRMVQLELLRVGCGEGAADGEWSSASQDAVERFNEHGRWAFNPSAPSPGLLAALRRSGGRVCPLECDPGFEAQGNTCVAIREPAQPSARPTKKATRHPAKEPAAKRHSRKEPAAKRHPQKPAAASRHGRDTSRRERREAARAAEPRPTRTRRQRERSAEERPRAPRQEAPYTCFTDEGGGRRRPCDAGGGR